MEYLKRLIRHRYIRIIQILVSTFQKPSSKYLIEKFGVNLEQHHRAIYDSESTGHLCWIFLKEAKENHDMHFHDDLNRHIGEGDSYKRARPFHATILATTQAGLKIF